MITNLILVYVAVAIFIAYNAVAIKLFGIPSSLSITFYHFESIRKGLGWIFTVMMWVVTLLMFIPWIEVTEVISSWSHYLTFLPAITCIALLFSSMAGNARESEVVEKVHLIGAKLAAATAVIWICVVCWKIAYILPAWILVIGGVAHLTKTAKSARDYWWEMVAFGATFTTLITELALHI